MIFHSFLCVFCMFFACLPEATHWLLGYPEATSTSIQSSPCWAFAVTSRERKVGTAAATKRRLGQKHTNTFPRKKGQWEIPLKWTWICFNMLYVIYIYILDMYISYIYILYMYISHTYIYTIHVYIYIYIQYTICENFCQWAQDVCGKAYIYWGTCNKQVKQRYLRLGEFTPVTLVSLAVQRVCCCVLPCW